MNMYMYLLALPAQTACQSSVCQWPSPLCPPYSPLAGHAGQMTEPSPSSPLCVGKRQEEEEGKECMLLFIDEA